MALAQIIFFSEVLKMETSMYVILPQDLPLLTGKGYRPLCERIPVLYLLHGLGGDHTHCLRFTSIERYVSSLNLAVVIPTVHRSFYTDTLYGLRYWTFISEELPQVARSFFPLSENREENFVAGISMGGYGAMKLVLNHSDKFSAGTSIFGGVDMANFTLDKEAVARTEFHPKEFHSIFGDYDKIAGSDNDLLKSAETLALSDKMRPKIFQCCGTEDFTY